MLATLLLLLPLLLAVVVVAVVEVKWKGSSGIGMRDRDGMRMKQVSRRSTRGQPFLSILSRRPSLFGSVVCDCEPRSQSGNAGCPVLKPGHRSQQRMKSAQHSTAHSTHARTHALSLSVLGSERWWTLVNGDGCCRSSIASLKGARPLRQPSSREQRRPKVEGRQSRREDAIERRDRQR